MYDMVQYQCLWMLWNNDRDKVYLEKEIPVLSLLGYAVFMSLIYVKKYVLKYIMNVW